MRPALVGPVRVPDLLPWLSTDPESLPYGMARGTTPATQLAVGLLQAGHDLVVVSLDPKVRTEKVLKGPRLKLYVGPYREHGRTRDLNRTERQYVRRALRRERPQVVHAQWTYEFALGALASGIPTVVTVRDWAPTIFRLQPSPYRAVRLAMNWAAIWRASHFTVTSPYMRDRLQRWTRSEVPVIPNAVGTEVFTGPRRWPSRQVPMLLAVNNGFGRRKNVRTLLRAFPAVRRAYPGARLVLVGYDYEAEGPAERWARGHGLRDGVDFQGEVPNERVHTLMGSADAFVHPALEESFGYVLVEAMAAGLPVIAGSRSGAVPWVLGDGRAGVLVDVGSVEALSRGVIALLGDHQRRVDLSERGFREAARRFRIDQVARQYMATYERVAVS